jgi:hypothetical protein
VLYLIHPFPQPLPTFKKRQFLRRNLHSLTGFRIPPDIPLIFFGLKRTQSPDFNPITLFECTGHLNEKQIYNFHCFNFGNISGGAKGLDEVEFVHGDPFFGKYSLSCWMENIENIYNSVTVSVKRMC